MGHRLQVELVPSTSWGNNLRALLTRSQWDKLRRATYKKAGNRCEICGGKGRRHPVECHEIWSYDEIDCVQKLEGLIALCPACHLCKHPGFAETIGKLPVVYKQLMKVNEISRQEARDILVEAMRLWHKRSKKPWSLDLSWLREHDIDPPV